ncbi:hypothetical protein [Selenomonas montiformis]|uniref:hypothetical protein n=1 Tax=Selenomonas montiformis TaxID=2652285 RepID=UPI0012B5C60C|nr:hypothetical protein [Selenomonas montiformis]
MDNRIPALQYALFADAFWRFSSLAKQYHFYDEEVARMEQALLDIDPFPRQRKENTE